VGFPKPPEKRTSPPLLGDRPAMDQTCGRWLGTTNCGKPATWHFMWTPEGDNGLTCDEHHDEALRVWTHHDRHPITAVCTMPDANWFFSWDEPPGYCRWVVGDEELVAQANAQEVVNV
jgi:hypothetical protein